MLPHLLDRRIWVNTNNREMKNHFCPVAFQDLFYFYLSLERVVNNSVVFIWSKRTARN